MPRRFRPQSAAALDDNGILCFIIDFQCVQRTDVVASVTRVVSRVYSKIIAVAIGRGTRWWCVDAPRGQTRLPSLGATWRGRRPRGLERWR